MHILRRIGAIICATAGLFLARIATKSAANSDTEGEKIQSIFCGFILFLWLASITVVAVWLLLFFWQWAQADLHLVMSKLDMKLFYMLIALLISFTAHAENKFCMYPDNETGELEQSKNCGSIKNGLLHVQPSLLDKVMWSKFGMQCIYLNYPENRGWFYINQNGLGRGSPFNYDNDCNWFQSGVAVGVSNGRVVYFNQVMKIVKSTKYTWASNFYKGYSKVCTGVLIKEYDEHGEHFQLKGGQCGFINREFKIVVPIQHPYESTPKPENS